MFGGKFKLARYLSETHERIKKNKNVNLWEKLLSKCFFLFLDLLGLVLKKTHQSLKLKVNDPI